MNKKWLIGAGITVALVLSGCTDNEVKPKVEKEVEKVVEVKDESILGVTVFEKNWNAVSKDHDLSPVIGLKEGMTTVQESLDFVFILDESEKTNVLQVKWTDDLNELENSHKIISALAKTLDQDITKEGTKQWKDLHDMVRKADLSKKEVVMMSVHIDGTHKATFLKRDPDPAQLETEEVYMLQVQKLTKEELEKLKEVRESKPNDNQKTNK